MSMSVITLTSSSKTSISTPPEPGKTGREASFSSYLDGAEETFVLKLGAARTRALTSSLPTEREIDVFNAEKYFNDSPQSGAKNPPIHQMKKDDPIEILAIKEQPPPTAALSIRSESSWNSRSALLHTLSRNHRPRKKSFLAAIACNYCSCVDNNSTIDECVGENSVKSRNDHKNRGNLVVKSDPDYNYVKFDEPANSNGHFSFPVIQNKKLENRANSVRIEKKISMLTWDAIAPNRGEEIKIPSISREMQHDDGNSDSDASSDLFEIESFSRTNPFHSKQASEGCRTPTNCYAPSEASIDWSVITASAADFTILSDSEDVASNKKACLNSKPGPFKEIPKLRSGILSGCKNQKAVSVAGDAHRARTGRQSFDSRVLSRSRTVNLLYT